MAFKMRSDHWDVMVSAFEEHPCLATGRFPGPNGRQENKKLWSSLADKLNSLGFGERSLDKWQKTWTDMKYLLKKKGSSIKQDLSGTGGGPAKETAFTPYELRLLEILGPSFYEGIGAPEIGCLNQENQELSTVSQRSNQPAIPGTSKNKRILEEHNYDYTTSTSSNKKKRKITIEDSYEETITILRGIQDTIKQVPEELRGIREELRELKEVLKR